MVLCNKSGMKRLLTVFVSIIAAACLFAFFPVNAYADSSYSVSLDDFDNCLTHYEETELKTEMLKTANRIKCNIGIVITADLEGKQSRTYADSYSDDKFGYGSDSIVLLLLNRHNQSKYSNESIYRDWISTDGYARTLYDRHIDGILDRAYRGLDNEFPGSEPEHIDDVYEDTDSIQFFMTGKYFCKALVSYRSPISRFFNNALSFFWTNPVVGLAFIAIPIAITVAVVSATVSKYKKKKPLSAAEYIDRSHFRIKREVDQFVREYTTSVSINTSSGGGGRSGGGGGGGHGGGGGRSR